MGKTVAYIRASTDKQDLKNQRLKILDYAHDKKLHINEFVAITISSRKDSRQRRIDELLEKLVAGDTLVVTELSRLGRSTGEVITLINLLLAHNIRVVILKQNLDLHHNHDMTSKVMITLFSLFAELERDLISMRTKEALAAKKAQGVQLGKPHGTIQESIYDQTRSKIVEMLSWGVSRRKISEHLGFGNHASLNYYINRRHLQQEADALRAKNGGGKRPAPSAL
jgi:DNA invertase Pin-like site-specific DNA recombinase